MSLASACVMGLMALGVFAQAITPTVTLSSSSNPSVEGITVSITATVSGSSGTPTGTVFFRDGLTLFDRCEAIALSGGIAVCTTDLLNKRDHSITAEYGGDATYTPATSPVLIQSVIDPPPPGVALTSSVNPSFAGYSTVLTATVTVLGLPASGHVAFYDTGFGAILSCSSIPAPAGTASCNTSTLAVGTHDISAYYIPDTHWYRAGFSATLSQTVLSAPAVPATNVALASNGGVATASSSWSADYPPAAANNGDRKGAGYGAGGVWNDATFQTFPDWLQIQFAGTMLVDRVAVYSMQNDYRSPVEPTDTMIADVYVVRDFDVEYLSGGAWVTAASILRNKLAKRTVTFGPVAADGIRVRSKDALRWSRLAEVEAWAPTYSGGTNVALSSAGAVATASSEWSADYPVSAVNDGSRTGDIYGNSGIWNDATRLVYPDWVEVQLPAARTIDRVVVYTMQDTYWAPVEPSDTMRFRYYGVVDFDVQAWSGGAWTTVATVTNNSLVKRTVAFNALTTDRIRIQINNAFGRWSRIAEIEVWAP